MNKQCTDLKMRIQKLETENARLEGNVSVSIYFCLCFVTMCRVQHLKSLYYFFALYRLCLDQLLNRYRDFRVFS